ncbi:poly-beta-hydroxybutyrate-responsive repressor [Priestia koreensis]|uniref:poly-beta-hydroxybutyrate-responsive repressor n=1 Tax=Priestia koreensis TaxID=284581 RepID=UPI001F5A27DD|nr:poly-beta-hydroxybutyrate-responsive repressor [Priestia koreensis]MCM3003024.1 poly-beta-hydroxybutyrate-responsive repressor [Priestia koreensis]UNL85842.1 poly-beta-hydroxybutyrate-responsive repressor [Priestia koreensis]
MTKKQEAKSTAEKSMSGAPKNFMIPFLLLSLRGWNLHGYKLIQQLMSFGFTSVDQGNVYRTLRQLEKDDLIASEWDTTADGPARRIYSLTKAGEQYLELWAGSLEQYQTMLNSFFSLYTDMLFPFGTKKDEPKNHE